jgi:hypothetical protein
MRAPADLAAAPVTMGLRAERALARQKAPANLGEFALRRDDLDDVLREACGIVADALDTEFAKAPEIEHDARELLVGAGVGWRPGTAFSLEFATR